MKICRRRVKSVGGQLPNALRPRTAAAPGVREAHAFLWGPFRLHVGLIQMAFSLTAIFELLLHGISLTALACAAVSSVAMVLSRVLYHGRAGVGNRRH